MMEGRERPGSGALSRAAKRNDTSLFFFLFGRDPMPDSSQEGGGRRRGGTSRVLSGTLGRLSLRGSGSGRPRTVAAATGGGKEETDGGSAAAAPAAPAAPPPSTTSFPAPPPPPADASASPPVAFTTTTTAASSTSPPKSGSGPKLAPALSLHGESAAARAAASELLFFASVGDVSRCASIVATWGLDLRTVADYDRRTPLHLAAAEGAHSVAAWLLGAGAPVNPVDRFGRTPLADAALAGQGELVRLLREAGGRVAATTAGGGGGGGGARAGGKGAAGDTAALTSSRPLLAAPLVDLAASDLAFACHPSSANLLLLGGAGAGGAAASPLASPDALQPEWEINPASLALGAVIGAGEFGVVHAARWWGQPVAVKVLRRSIGTDGAGAAAGPGTTTNAAAAIALGDLRSELAVLQRVHHPQTVQFLGAVTSSRPYMIVSELVSGGSVGDLLVDIQAGRAPPLPARRAAEIGLDCARGLAYLHSRQHLAVIHRDMKPGNVLLACGAHLPPGVDARAAARAVGLAKISDFGLSKSLQLSPLGGVGGVGGVGGGGGGGGEGGAAPAAPPAPGHPPVTATSSLSGAYKLTGETGSYR